MPSAVVEENVDYYIDYINVEMRKGRTEAEVLASLGDPRLIARTIIQTSGAAVEDYVETGRNTGYEDRDSSYRSFPKIIRLPGWLTAIIIILAVVLGFSLIFSVLSFLAPVLLVFGAVIFMVKLFRDWLN